MGNYDKMSVHELLFEAAKDGLQAFWHDAFPELCDLPEIETAIRRAVLREELATDDETIQDMRSMIALELEDIEDIQHRDILNENIDRLLLAVTVRERERINGESRNSGNSSS